MRVFIQLLKYLVFIVVTVVLFRMLYRGDLSREGGMILLVLIALLTMASVASALIGLLTQPFLSRAFPTVLVKACVFATSFELAYFLLLKKPCLFGLAAP